MRFDPQCLRESVRAGGVVILQHTPLNIYVKERNLAGYSNGCILGSLMCALAGVNSACIGLANRAIQAANACMANKNDIHYIDHWTQSRCLHNIAIANWILSGTIDQNTLQSSASELDKLHTKIKLVLHKSDLEWGLFAYLLAGRCSAFRAAGEKFGFKSQHRGIKSDFMFGCALTCPTGSLSVAEANSMQSYLAKQTKVYIDTGCYYHAVMLSFVHLFMASKRYLGMRNVIDNIYSILEMPFPGEVDIEPDLSIVEYARNRTA